MKKSAISLSLLLLVGATALTSCNSSEVKPLKDKDGKDVLFSIGDQNFTADELLGSKDVTYSFLKSEEGAKELYRAIEKAIVETKVAMNDNIKNAVEIKMDDWAKKVESFAEENDLTERLAEQSLLTQEGFETRKDLEANYVFLEKKAQYLKDYKLDKIQPEIDTTTKLIKEGDESKLAEYVENTNPMIMKHVLVKTADSANAYKQANITEDEADHLGTVVKRLALGNKGKTAEQKEKHQDVGINSFANVAVDLSDDGSAKNGGNLGIVDEYTSFVSEFKFGVYSSLAYEAKAAGKDDVFNDIVERLNLNADNFEPAEIDSLSHEVTKPAGMYATMGTIDVLDACKALIDNKHIEKPTKEGLSKTDRDNFNKNKEKLFPRNMEFNSEFNFVGAKYLVVSDKTAFLSYLNNGVAESDKVTEADLNINDKGYVLDENGNPIVVTRSEFGIHFISVTWSSLGKTKEEKVGYFVTDTSYKDGETGYYQNEMFNKGSSSTVATLQKNRKNEIENRVTNYIQGGYSSNVTADEQIMIYKMILEDLNNNVVSIPNEEVKNTIKAYLELKVTANNTTIDNSIEDTIEAYDNKVSASKEAQAVVKNWLKVEGGKYYEA